MRTERRRIDRPTDSSLGPYSAQDRLDSAINDGRTILSKIYRGAVESLTSEIGNPTAMEQIVIEIAASRLCRVYLLNKKFFEEGKVEETTSERAISWMSSLTRDLAMLGLKRTAKEITPSLGDIIKDHAKTKTGGLAR